jgi:hypothetical protein
MNMKNYLKYTLIFAIIFMVSCNKRSVEDNDRPLAKVNDKFLYESELRNIFTTTYSKDDSVTIARNFINDWIKKQLMLEKAELNLGEESKDIEKQIEDYRSSLLIFKYKQELINQKMDTIVTDVEVKKYYDEYSANFVLNHNIVKALYLKISKEAPEVDKIKRWYKSDNAEDISRMEDYCYQYATKYDDFDTSWIPFNNLLIEVPANISDQERYLRYRKYIETEDEQFYYFVRLYDYSLKSTIQPLEYAESKIKSIILNKRKFTFLDELENSVYNDALNHNEFIIY